MWILSLVEKGESARNRPATQTATRRRFSRLCGRKNWFKLTLEGEKPKERGFKVKRPTKAQERAKIEAVMFVPYTQGGTLKQKLTQMEENLGFNRRFKYVERVGVSMEATLVTKDPWAGDCE